MKILSIDLDFIFEPIIQLYNSSVDTGIPPEKNWENIYEDLDLKRHLDLSDSRLIALENLMMSLDKNIPCYFGYDHSAIIIAMDQFDKNMSSVDLYNIDHHHDLYYNPTQQRDVDRFDICNCADWVYYLANKNLISSYHWIKNQNSKQFDFGEFEWFHEYVYETELTLSLIPQDIDLIFVTSSLHYSPITYWEILDMFKEQVLKEHFISFTDLGGQVSHPGHYQVKYF